MVRRSSLLVFVLFSCVVFTQAQTPAQQAAQLIKDEWGFELRTSPEFATYLGDHRYDDQVSDLRPAAIQAQAVEQKAFLARAKQIDLAKLDEQDALNIRLLRRKLQMSLDKFPLEPWLMPVDQMGGPHTEYAQLAQQTVFRNAEDYDHYIARLKKLPAVFAQVTALMREGMQKKLMPPAFLLPEAAHQAQVIASEKGEESPFAVPLKNFPDTVSEADRKRIREQVMAVVETDIVPTYEKFAKFLQDEYAPAGRKEPGVWSLPHGAERYQMAIREITTTDLKPDEIHELGLKQVQQIHQEMLVIAQQFGYKDLASFHEAIRNNKNLYGKSGDQILGLYKQHLDDITKDLPKLFGRLPKAKLEVIPMPSYRSAQVPADYSPGTPDGSRPGHVNVNETEPTKRLLLNLEAIAYHEGLPGHHLQISLAYELPDLPDFRRNGDYTAFVEGWALYSEQLGKELGYYQDPYSNYGRLENEMWRAIRLVVDTGVHSQHWTRQQMVDYFHTYTAMDEPNINTEVDRYIAWPAQALAYKIGQLTILRLRESAKQQLGDKFDLRAFHDELLGAGALPMDVLEERMNGWIAQQKSNPAAGLR